MSTNPNTQGVGHDFSPRGRKLLWGVPENAIKLANTQIMELDKPSQTHDIESENNPEVTITTKPQRTQVNYILKPKSRSGQKWIKATGDFKPPHARICRQISCFDTLDQTGNRMSYYKHKHSVHSRLSLYIRQEEISNRKIKRCTLHSYLQCGESTVDKKNCTVCVFFQERRKDDSL